MYEKSVPDASKVRAFIPVAKGNRGNKKNRDQCDDHYFGRFSPICCKNGVFLEKKQYVI
jgi:hypothetical protein